MQGSHGRQSRRHRMDELFRQGEILSSYTSEWERKQHKGHGRRGRRSKVLA